MAQGIITALPLFKYKVVTVGDVTIGANGYTDIQSYKPATPSGYQLFAASFIAGSSPNGAIGVTGNGNYVIGKAGIVVSGLKMYYCYCLSEDYVGM